jgi:hypothetical protein
MATAISLSNLRISFISSSYHILLSLSLKIFSVVYQMGRADVDQSTSLLVLSRNWESCLPFVLYPYILKHDCI